MAQHYTITTFRDHGAGGVGEVSSVKVYNGPITALSIAGFLTDYGNLKTALEGISAGVLASDMWVGDATQISSASAASKWAQRELKIQVTYEGDTSGKLYTLTIPCADLDALTLLPGDMIELADGGAMAAFVTAFETIARTPDDDTETVTVRRAKLVGRNI